MQSAHSSTEHRNPCAHCIRLHGVAEIRAAARALSQKSRLTNALSIAVNEVRVALAAGRARAQAMALSCDDEAVRSGLRPFSERCACTRTHGRSSQTARELWRWSGTYIRSSDSEGARSVWLSRCSSDISAPLACPEQRSDRATFPGSGGRGYARGGGIYCSPLRSRSLTKRSPARPKAHVRPEPLRAEYARSQPLLVVGCRLSTS